MIKHRISVLALISALATGVAGCGGQAGPPGPGDPAGPEAPGAPDTTGEPAAAVEPAPNADEPFDRVSWTGEIEAWRTRRVERLRSDTGWLTVVGLHWMKEGTHRFGTEESNEIVLPAGTAPAQAGELSVQGGRATVTPAAGVELLLDEKPVAAGRELASDATGKPDVLRLGELSLYMIDRNGRMALRVKDPNSPAREAFEGIDYYPVTESWRLVGEFVPYDEPKIIDVPTVMGTTTPMQAPGTVRFATGGGEITLEPVVEGPEDPEFFFIFKDDTSGTETYPAGRFLYTASVRSGPVVLDFNKAYNPPCAFTEFATCPLPPSGNVIAGRIEAGEKYSSGH